jgi:hypothetical protein
MIDIRPAADRTASLVTSVADEQLDLPTPCPGSCLGDLIDHVGSLSRAFLASARKQTGDRDGPPPKPSATTLGPGWRDQVTGDLHALADAWQEPEAWEGFTTAGGIAPRRRRPDSWFSTSWSARLGHRCGQRTALPAGRAEVDAAMAFVGSSRPLAMAASSVRSSRSPTPPRRWTG